MRATAASPIARTGDRLAVGTTGTSFGFRRFCYAPTVRIHVEFNGGCDESPCCKDHDDGRFGRDRGHCRANCKNRCRAQKSRVRSPYFGCLANYTAVLGFSGVGGRWPLDRLQRAHSSRAHGTVCLMWRTPRMHRRSPHPFLPPYATEGQRHATSRADGIRVRSIFPLRIERANRGRSFSPGWPSPDSGCR